MTSMENLRFAKEGYLQVLVFYGLFYKGNRKHFSPRVPIRYRNTRESLGEPKIAWKFRTSISRSPNLTLVFL